MKRQRADFQHKTALHLLRTYDVIYLEDLRVANLVRNPYLAKSISDAAWAQFRAILEAKAAYAGRRVRCGSRSLHQPGLFGHAARRHTVS